MKTSNYNNNFNSSEIMMEHLRKLDEIIQNNLGTKVSLIDSMVKYIINSGGKRLRPITLICFSLAINNIADNKIYSLAAVIEFIHTATLLHDDVVDESALRRGKETANQVFGNSPSVLVGDFLYSRAFEMMVEIGSMPIMQVLSKATNIIAQGEVLQLMNIANLDININTYLEVIEYKTAKLFEASTHIAAIINNRLDLINNAKSYGHHLGCAFQLIDDWLDYAGETTILGKSVGDDLRQGKITMPIIYLLQNNNEEQKLLLQNKIHAIKEGKINIEENIKEVINLVKNSPALEYTKQQAIIHSQKAKQAILSLDNTYYKDCLNQICDMAIERVF